MVLGDFRLTLGKHVVTGRDAVLWIRSQPAAGGLALSDVEAYVEGDAKVTEPDGGSTSDKSMFVTLHFRGRLMANGTMSDRPLKDFPLYAKAIAARQNAREAAAAQTAPSAPPTLIVSTQPGPRPGVEVVRTARPAVTAVSAEPKPPRKVEPVEFHADGFNSQEVGQARHQAADHRRPREHIRGAGQPRQRAVPGDASPDGRGVQPAQERRPGPQGRCRALGAQDQGDRGPRRRAGRGHRRVPPGQRGHRPREPLLPRPQRLLRLHHPSGDDGGPRLPHRAGRAEHPHIHPGLRGPRPERPRGHLPQRQGHLQRLLYPRVRHRRQRAVPQEHHPLRREGRPHGRAKLAVGTQRRAPSTLPACRCSGGREPLRHYRGNQPPAKGLRRQHEHHGLRRGNRVALVPPAGPGAPRGRQGHAGPGLVRAGPLPAST